MTIPGEHGAGAMTYCTLAESAGGVTEKVSLVRLAKVTEQLGRLRDTDVADVDAYIAHRGNYKLSTEAILKLPKHGSIEEVQRESMALNISRILHLDTTSSSMVSHNGKPALFVPFENIRLLKDFAQGKTFTPFGSSKSYEHYSTINPVGEGVQGDSFVEDFGNALGLFYICSDPDSIGGYNQNKALRDNRSLFIFDQVVMPSDKLKLDSRISLQPDDIIMGHTRHGRGRNRTLIEDSSFTAKFDSIVEILRQQERIYKYANRTIALYTNEIERINRDLGRLHTPLQDKELKEQKAQFGALLKDAINLREAVKSRIDKIGTTLPRRSRDLSNNDICQALVLEKLVHNPRLFTDLGRPYKNPWTTRQDNPVTLIATTEPGKLYCARSQTEVFLN